jgi:hypothetical protein
LASLSFSGFYQYDYDNRSLGWFGNHCELIIEQRFRIIFVN